MKKERPNDTYNEIKKAYLKKDLTHGRHKYINDERTLKHTKKSQEKRRHNEQPKSNKN